MATNKQITSVLESVRHAKRIIFLDRDINVKSWREFGWTVDDMKDIMKSLKPENYVKGPEPDHDSENHSNEPIWVFLKMHEGKELYIKFKVLKKLGHIWTISFHISNKRH